MGGVIVVLTRGMGEWLTYRSPVRYPVVLERLGGLFFDGRRSCTEDSFIGRSGLCRGESLVVSILEDLRPKRALKRFREKIEIMHKK